ncbi:MAG: hypothetical protein KAT77_01115 [Nanoarchaeota archaeon]|nr:hypothetical protein [Nanoarchaeota archaeon]
MELTFEYPIINGLTYGLVIDNPENRAFMSPTYFLLGDIRRARRTQIKEWFGQWLEFESQPKDFEKLLNFDKRFNVGKTENGSNIRRNLHDLSPLELVTASEFRTRMKRHYDGSASFVKRGGDDVFTYKKKRQKQGTRLDLEPHTGNVVLSGYVRKKGDARKGAFRSSFHKITLKGPFKNSAIPFAQISDDCRYFDEIKKKGGYETLQIIDTDVAALLLHAAKNPNKVKDFQGNREFFVPFRTDTIDERILGYHRIEDLPYLSQSQFSLVPLKMDIFLARYFKNMGYFTLDKILTKLPTFDLQTIELINQGKAKYIVIPQAFPLDQKDLRSMEPEVAALYSMILKNLKDDGFVLKDIVLEKKDSVYETPCLHFEGPDNQIRRVTLDGRPPIIIKRKNTDGTVYPVRSIEGNSHIDFFVELYRFYKKDPNNLRKGVLDDMTRAVSDYMVTLPEPRKGQFIPESILKDYAQVIDLAIQIYNQKKPEHYVAESFNRASNRARASGFKRAPGMIGFMRKLLNQ